MYPEGYSSSTSVPVGPAVSLTVHGSFARTPPTPPRRAVPTVARTGLATTAFATSATRSHVRSRRGPKEAPPPRHSGVDQAVPVRMPIIPVRVHLPSPPPLLNPFHHDVHHPCFLSQPCLNDPIV